MRKEILLTILIILLPVMIGCSTSPINTSNNAIVVESLSVSPQVLPPSGFALISIEAFDADGNELFYRIGTGESIPMKDNKSIIFQVPQLAGTQEMIFSISNGRQDVSKTIEISIDNSLASSIGYGTAAELPLGKSFDFLAGAIKDQYYGDLDFYKSSYGDYYLSFSGNGSGGVSYSYFDGGIANLNVFASAEDYSKIFYPYYGYYLDTISSDYYYDEEKIIVNKNYAIWFMRGTKNYYAKIRILKYDDEGLVFDWLVQMDSNKAKFYE